MRRLSFAVVCCIALLAGCTSEKPVVQTPVEPAQPAAQVAMRVGDYTLQQPIQAGSVSIIPITYTNPNPKSQVGGDFITLAEAKKAGLVEITELGDEAVETLAVTNKSDRPLLLLGGDLLLGGKQDRIVARDTIVPPGKTMNVDVYCVEHGRWDGASDHFEYKDTVVPDRVRQAAAHKSQGDVWAEVDGYNSRSGLARGSVTVAAGLETTKVKQAVSDQLPKILDSLKDKQNVVGFIYVLNGEVQSADLFGSPKLLQAAQGSVLKGYLADGANVPAKTSAPFSMSVCRKFMREILDGREARKVNVSDRSGFKFETQWAQGVEIGAPSEAAGGGGYVHGNYSLKK